MKSKKEMQKVIVALSVASMRGKGTTPDEKSRMLGVLDVLLWVMDYPNNFQNFAEPTIKLCPVSDDELESVFNEAIASYEGKDTLAE